MSSSGPIKRAAKNDARDQLILAFGELLWDRFPTGPLLGGAPANFAVRMAELGYNIALVSRVGVDELGQSALRQLHAVGVTFDPIQADSELPTGTVEVTYHAGQPSYRINENVAYDRIEPLPEEFNSEEPGLIYFGTLIQRSGSSAHALYDLLERSPSALKFLDLNLREGCYSKEIVERSLRAANLAKFNLEELKEVSQLLGLSDGHTNELLTRIVESFDLKVGIVTLGKLGALALDANGQLSSALPYPVRSIDPVGAGDAFAAGFAAATLSGFSVQKGLEIGNRLGAIATTVTGGLTPLPGKELLEVAQLLMGEAE